MQKVWPSSLQQVWPRVGHPGPSLLLGPTGRPGFEQEAASASAEFVPVFGRDESFV